MSNLKLKYVNLCYVLIIFSCNHAGYKGNPVKTNTPVNSSSQQMLDNNEAMGYGEPVQDPALLIKDFSAFWSYFNKHIDFDDEFIALDGAFKKIDKLNFLESLCTGEFLPLKLTSSKQNYYQLYKAVSWPEIYIPVTIKNIANSALYRFKMEGKIFPEFDFVDIRGNRINTDNTKGKILVIKFWFINCIKCIEEFPDLNRLVGKYKERNDIIFLSIALDDDQNLRQFLDKRRFNYRVIGNQESFIEKLGISEYPTHIIVDKDYVIKKVLANNMFLEKYLLKMDN